MNNKISFPIIGCLLVTSLTLVGCDKVSNSSHSPSSNQTNQTQTEYTPCRFNQAVSGMIDNLRNKPNYLEIEYAKNLYLDATTDPKCNGEAQSLKGVLRPVWQQSVNDMAMDSYISCNTACGLSNSLNNTNSSSCYNSCENERNTNINSDSQNIQNFFSSN